MAYIRRETAVAARPDEVWAALRDWGALHERLVRGFAVDTRVEGDSRIVTFASGNVLRERILSLDEQDRRLAWSIVDGPYEYHHASAQVLPDGAGATRFVWIADVLPDALAASTAASMDRGLAAIRTTLDRAS